MWDDVHTVESSDCFKPAGYVKTRFLLSSERVVSGPEDSPRQANIAGKKHLLSLPNKIKDTKNTRLQMFHRSDM